MTAYVPMEYNIQVGETVVLELHRGNDLLAVVQASEVKAVRMSPHHKDFENMAEVEF